MSLHRCYNFHDLRKLANKLMMERAKASNIKVMMLTADSITGGNRERDLRTGISIPFRVNLKALWQFASKPMWGINYVTHEKFSLLWGGEFCLKGIMSVEDARKAKDIGCTGIVVSNHGGRQLDGARSSFDNLAEIVDAVGDKVVVLFDGGMQRGTEVLKALSISAKAVGLGRMHLYGLAASGQPRIERTLNPMKNEIERDMRLMGCSSISQLSRGNLKFR